MLIVYSYSIAIAIANKDYTVVNFVVRILGRGMKLVVQDMDLKNPVLVRGLGLG